MWYSRIVKAVIFFNCVVLSPARSQLWQTRQNLIFMHNQTGNNHCISVVGEWTLSTSTINVWLKLRWTLCAGSTLKRKRGRLGVGMLTKSLSVCYETVEYKPIGPNSTQSVTCATVVTFPVCCHFCCQWESYPNSSVAFSETAALLLCVVLFHPFEPDSSNAKLLRHTFLTCYIAIVTKLKCTACFNSRYSNSSAMGLQVVA